MFNLNCGKVPAGNPLSIGGEFSLKGQWPWFAPLFNKKRNDTFFCGSTIISKRYLLGGKLILNLSKIDFYFTFIKCALKIF